MSVDRKALNTAIDALSVATKTHKALRAEYVKEVRDVGVELRKKLCNKGGPTAWLANRAAVDELCTHDYGILITIEGMRDEAITAVIEYLNEHDWNNARVVKSDKYRTEIMAH